MYNCDEKNSGCLKYIKDIPQKYNYDFVVCGGGMTGVAAAIAAGRKGVRTLLVERNGCLGGNATVCGVNHLLGAKQYIPQKHSMRKCVSGIFDEICDRMIASGQALDPYKVDFSLNPHGWGSTLGEGLIFDAECLKLLLEQMCEEAGVKLLYYTDIVDVLCSDGHIDGILAHNKSGLFAIKGRYYADTTGDADIAYLSGCETHLGRDDDSLMAPATLQMHVEGVDTDKLAAYIRDNGAFRFRKEIEEWRKQGIWDFPFDIFISVQLTRKDVYMINTIRQVGISGIDGDSLTDGTIDGRRQNFKLFEIMKKYIPGFENSSIRMIAPAIGIRETRRLVGKYTMTTEDLMTGKSFDDIVALSGYGWDLPDPKKPSYQPFHNKVKNPEYTPIPYSCLVPRECDNLIVAGRCISVEREVLGPVREMGPCVGMGQAVGLATAQILDISAKYADVDVKALQKEICACGGIVSPKQIQERFL